MLAAEMQQYLAHLAQQRAIRDAKHLVACMSRVGQWPQDIKDGSNTNLAACRPDVFHRRMVGRGEHKAETDLAHTARDLLRAEIDFRTQRLQHVGTAALAGSRTVAVLGNRGPGGGGENASSSRNVEGAGAVASGAASIHREIGR